MNSFHVDLLTVLGVLVAIGGLLSLMSALDPTTRPRQRVPHPRTSGASVTRPAPDAGKVAAAGTSVVEQSPHAA